MEFKQIQEIKIVDYDGAVYDIELEKNHYFAANNIISHNCRLRSETENRFFVDDIFYEVEREDGEIIKISNKESIAVMNLETNELENVYIDEIKDKLDSYELVI